MPLSTSTPKSRALCELLNTTEEELEKHTRDVYEWRGLLYEILTIKQARGNGIPNSHYLTYTSSKRSWKVRELGEKSELYQSILKEGGEK